MFEFIRNNRRFLQFVLLILIVPSFVFFGLQGYDRMGGGNNLAEVGSQVVSQAEFDNTMKNQLERYKQILGPNADLKQYDTPEAREGVLDSLIAQKVVGIEAQRSNLLGSDDKLRETIKTLPGVVVDGKYDNDAYKRFASSQGFSSPDAFEAKLRADTGIQMLAGVLQNAVIVPKAMSDGLAGSQDRSYSIQERLFKASSYADQVKFEAADVEKFYTEKRKQFETPERAKVEYVVFDIASVAKGITISDADLKTYYEQNKNRLGQPEERQASHILIKADAKASDKEIADAKAKATSLFEQAKKDPSQFAKLAKEHSQDPGSGAQGGDLGFFKREAMVKPFSDTAFGMKQGEIAAPVKSDFGWHVIQLTGIKAANIKSYEAAKTELETELKNQQASKKFAEQTEQFSNLVYEQADSFKTVADKFKLDIKTLDGVNRASMKQVAPAGSPNANPFNEKLANALFEPDAVKAKKNSEAVEISKGSLISARIVDYTAAKTLPLTEVKATVEAQLRQELAQKMAKSEGELALKALQAKAKDTIDGLSIVQEISQSKPASLAPVAVAAIARASVKGVPTWAGVALPNGEFGVYKIVASTSPAAIDAAKQQASQDTLKRAYAEQETQSLVALLRNRHNAKVIKPPVVTDPSNPARPNSGTPNRS